MRIAVVGGGIGGATLLEELPFGTRQPIWEYDVRDALAAAGIVAKDAQSVNPGR